MPPCRVDDTGLPPLAPARMRPRCSVIPLPMEQGLLPQIYSTLPRTVGAVGNKIG